IIGSDTVILPGSVITGRTVIGKGCTIGPSAVLDGCTVGDGACVNASQIKGGAVAENECVGPFVSR
ncbi:MAG: UDP-N-acetylglucosamine diphosphorylase, partial [Clostridia bacterium]|nr:UDP-N-acetylglucosamine diphosphorylase [Clostridia bacterium]